MRTDAAACSMGRAEREFWSEYSVDFESELGAGSFGVGRRGVCLATGNACAIKCMRAGAQCLVEVRLQEELRHPSVCRLFGYVMEAGKLFAALEFCMGGIYVNSSVAEQEVVCRGQKYARTCLIC